MFNMQHQAAIISTIQAKEYRMLSCNNYGSFGLEWCRWYFKTQGLVGSIKLCSL